MLQVLNQSTNPLKNQLNHLQFPKLFQQCKECRVISVSTHNKHWCPGKVDAYNPLWQSIIIPLFCCMMQSGYIWECKKCKVMIGDPNKHWNIFHCIQQSDDKFLENMSTKKKRSPN